VVFLLFSVEDISVLEKRGFRSLDGGLVITPSDGAVLSVSETNNKKKFRVVCDPRSAFSVAPCSAPTVMEAVRRIATDVDTGFTRAVESIRSAGIAAHTELVSFASREAVESAIYAHAQRSFDVLARASLVMSENAAAVESYAGQGRPISEISDELSRLYVDANVLLRSIELAAQRGQAGVSAPPPIPP
jgi:hypothetical protein